MKKIIIILVLLLCIPAYFVYSLNKETKALEAKLADSETKQTELNIQLNDANAAYQEAESELAETKEAAEPFIEENEKWKTRTEELQTYLP
jgi:predicted Holliday junction resolvase-like endonuclease